MRATLFFLFCNSLMFCATHEADSTLSNLVEWQKDTGEWINAGTIQLDPDNVLRLTWEDGKGILTNGANGKTVNLHSIQYWGNIDLHIEFMIPKGSNSGVYFQSRYELQIFDSWGVENPTFSDCGGIYQRWIEETQTGFEGFPPRVNASGAYGEWQKFDVIFHAPQFDNMGIKIKNAQFKKILLNGIVIHENVELSGPTRASSFEDEQPVGPLMLQGDHGQVAFKNIRVRAL